MHLIQRMCKSKSTAQLHFLIGGRVLKFGLGEFALITGLNYDEIPDVRYKGWGKAKKNLF